MSVLVSILCDTYNHVKYIKDALDGFLMQKCNFDYEIVVFDDASTDGTSEIIRDYVKKYPDKFVTYIQEHNTFRKPERAKIKFDIYKKCKGKYIALCEGDDYWTDPNKLQLQVSYMVSHPECTMTMHNAKVNNCITGASYPLQRNTPTGSLTSRDVILRPDDMYATASMVFKKEFLFMEPFFYKCKTGDVPRQLYAFSKGEVFYFNDIMSVYRNRHEGSWSYNNLFNKRNYILHCIRMIRLLNEYNEYTNKLYNTDIQSRKQDYCHHATRVFDCSIDDFFYECDELNKETDNEFEAILKDVKEFYRLKHDIHYYPDNLKSFVTNHKHLLIMGAGENFEFLFENFNNTGVDIDGIVVSNGNPHPDIIHGLPVNELKDINNIEDYGIIVSIEPRLYSDVLYSLTNNHAKHYHFYFMVDLS